MKIVGFCNPLLDLTLEVDNDYLDKYSLNANDAILASEKHIPIYSELANNEKVVFGAGGAGQNALRVAQWILSEPNSTAFFGAVGKDDFAEKMSNVADSVGLKVCYYNEGGLPTGSCAVLVNGVNRSMIANLSAANTYTVEHLNRSENWKIIENTQLFYITGFFHTVSPDSILKIGEYSSETMKRFCMNLSAPFLFEVPPFFESFKKVLPYVNVYFGNEVEFSSLSKAMGWGSIENNEITLEEVAKKLCLCDNKTSLDRIVVQTHGPNPTTIVIGNNTDGILSVNSYPIIPITTDKIVDTNGCGDAYAGGFIAGLSNKHSIEKCVKIANYCANTIIQHIGCDYPAEPDTTKF